MVIQGKYFLWTVTSNSLTENEEQDIPSHILKTIFELHASVIFRPKYAWFPIHLKGPTIPDPSGQLAELIVFITSTRVDLYSHQILLPVLLCCIQLGMYDVDRDHSRLAPSQCETSLQSNAVSH